MSKPHALLYVHMVYEPNYILQAKTKVSSKKIYSNTKKAKLILEKWLFQKVCC